MSCASYAVGRDHVGSRRLRSPDSRLRFSQYLVTLPGLTSDRSKKVGANSLQRFGHNSYLSACHSLLSIGLSVCVIDELLRVYRTLLPTYK